MGQALSSDEIRMLVREALRGAAPDASAVPSVSSSQGIDIAEQIREDLKRQGASTIAVQVSSDFDLNLFIGRILSLADAGDIRSAMAAGKVRFTLAGDGPSHNSNKMGNRNTSIPKGNRPTGNSEAYVIEKGVLNETKIAEIAKTHGRVEIGRGVVLTPLAKDRARELKLELIRRRP